MFLELQENSIFAVTLRREIPRSSYLKNLCPVSKTADFFNFNTSFSEQLEFV